MNEIWHYLNLIFSFVLNNVTLINIFLKLRNQNQKSNFRSTYFVDNKLQNLNNVFQENCQKNLQVVVKIALHLLVAFHSKNKKSDID